VAGFYFDFADQNDQSPANTMGALLKPVVSALEGFPEEVSQAYQKQRKALGGKGPQLSEIVKMLQAASCKNRTFICIDALDECVPEHRVKLLDLLNEIRRKSPGIRIFMTGRPHIRPEIQRRLTGGVTSLSISTKRDDIIRYLHSRLEQDTTPDAMDSSLEADILKKIPEDISEMYVEATALGKAPQASTNRYMSRFLLVSLNIDAILQEPTIYRRRRKLERMTDGLGLESAYGATLGRIKGQGEEKARLGMVALMWISHSERPLKADELCHALAVEIGSPDHNIDNVPSISTLLACCQGLAVVETEASTVRLIHLTLQEYLRAHPELFGTAHSRMAETCLIYLHSQQTKAFSTSPSPDHHVTPFLEYSSLYWGVHAKLDLSDHVKQLALKLFDDYNSHTPTKILLQAQKIYRSAVEFDKISLFSGLHYASFFGIVEIAAGLVEMESCDINQMDCGGNTPLVWAARNGHDGVVKMLLGRDGVEPDTADNEGRTPLWGAAHSGHEGVVKILLERDDIKPGRADIDGRTPLLCAAYSGHEGVVKMLLGRGGANPDKPDNDGRTPLLGAAYSGNEAVVKLLLRRDDINPDKPDKDGQTPLNWAAGNGCEVVVKILLGRDDVNPNKANNERRTPLLGAVLGGHEGVVKVLLRRGDVNPDEPDNDGQTPLNWAAYTGLEGMVEILLGRDGVDPEKPDNNGQTPLWIAASEGHEGVVKILLGRDDVNPDRPDNTCRTPLFISACRGHEGVVKMLLARGVNPDSPNIYGRTPLYRAAWNGREGVVKILLREDGVNPNKLDKDGKTPLDRATERGHQAVIALLPPPEFATPVSS